MTPSSNLRIRLALTTQIWVVNVSYLSDRFRDNWIHIVWLSQAKNINTFHGSSWHKLHLLGVWGIGRVSIHLESCLLIWCVRTFYQINYLCHQLEEKIIVSKCLPTIEPVLKKNQEVWTQTKNQSIFKFFYRFISMLRKLVCTNCCCAS